MSPRQRKIFLRDRSFGFTGSLVLHLLFLAAGSLVFAKPIEYAVEAGSGGLEVSLTAAPIEPAADETLPEPPKAIEEPPPAPTEPDSMPLPRNDIEERKTAPAEEKKETPQVQTAANSEQKGDGSSPVSGRDATTFYSAGGAITEAKPNYLKNPAPLYPRVARENGWEGVVVLKVSVDRTGRPTAVEKESGSGHDVLDQSALKTVRTWKFRPATLGALPVDSTVRVPVRFKLTDYKS